MRYMKGDPSGNARSKMVDLEGPAQGRRVSVDAGGFGQMQGGGGTIRPRGELGFDGGTGQGSGSYGQVGPGDGPDGDHPKGTRRAQGVPDPSPISRMGFEEPS